MKYLISLGLILFAFGASAQQQKPLPVETCYQQYGNIRSATKHTVSICRHAYLSQYDVDAKIPYLVTYKLNNDMLTKGCLPRSDSFAPDFSIAPSVQSSLRDYQGSGYDRGHMAPDGDMKYDPVVEHESFLLSNMTPQNQTLNREAWEHLESAVRSFTIGNKTTFTVYVGALYSVTSKHIGNNVIVPDSYFKIIYNNDSHESLAFYYPNLPGTSSQIQKFQTTVADIESKSGLKFNLPNSDKKFTVWPYKVYYPSLCKK